MAKSAEQKRLEELLAKQEKTIAAAFRRYIDTVKSRPVLRDILKALEAGDVNAALRILDTHIATLASSLNQVFISTATAEIEAARQLFSKVSPTVSISFDPGDLEASRIMRESRLSFIRDFTESQRRAVATAISDGLATGAGPRNVARSFRDSIGLTDQQVQWVNRYRRNLEELDSWALDRKLRDRRYDRTVERAIRDGKPLRADQIDRMVERYRQRALAYRSEVIARTEALSTVSEAREEAMRQAFEEVDMPAGRQIKVWGTAQDSRVRDTHRAMNGQKRTGEEPFQSPSGAVLRYPGDRRAPADEVIQCRCFIRYEIAPPE